MHASRLMRHRTPALALTVTVIATGLAAPALAQNGSAGASPNGTPSPSASPLWRTYPLHPARPSATRAETTPVAERTRVRAAASTRRPVSHDSAWSPVIVVLIAVLAVATIVVWALVLLRRQRGAGPDAAAGPAPDGAGERRGRGAAPPDPSCGWTAGIDWIEEGGSAHFRVLARAADGSATTPILRSPVLPWPPTDSGAVDAMTRAVERLEGRLLDAGWTPTAPGPAWYEKHFAWAAKPAAEPAPKRAAKRAAARAAAPKPEPKPAPQPKPKRAPKPTPQQTPRPKPPQQSARTRRPPSAAASSVPAATATVPAEKRSPGWPPEARTLWRCEIRFDAGYSASRFTATMHPPAGSEGRTRVVARSEPLRWLFMSPPDPKVPEHRGAAVALARALRAAGWEVVGRGGGWFAERYVWRHDGEPPTDIDVPEPAEQRKGESA
jgi:hypothetical protein